MKKVSLILTMLIILALVGTAMAIAPDKTVEFDGGAMGNVTFDGKKHADAGMKCMDCHPNIFQMKKGSSHIKPPHIKGELCWTCHTGEDGKPSMACNNCHRN